MKRSAETMHEISNNHTTNDSSHSTILVVDDHPANLEMLTEYLKAYGYNTPVANNGEAALEQATNLQPDIILLDVVMPGIDGFETCRRLKANPATKDIPVIFMTALTDTEDKIKGFKEGAVDYITKPIQYAEMLARISTHLRIRELTRSLEQTNRELVQTLDDLKTTQKQLIESEKIAALGKFIAGVAHEINTPIGVAVTASSALETKTKSLLNTCETGTVEHSAIQTYLNTTMRSSQLILKNVLRAAELIRHFKQVAIDHMSLESRTFPIKRYIEDTILGTIPKKKRIQHTFTMTGDDTIEIFSHPGAFSQVITHLVTNSVIHAYADDQHGHLCFHLKQEQAHVLIEYSDDGCGIPPDRLSKIFDPFFTTARNQGKTGLGMYIVYNLVTQILKGTIQCESQIGSGTKFILRLPLLHQD